MIPLPAGLPLLLGGDCRIRLRPRFEAQESTVELIHRVRAGGTIETALELEHRFTFRSMEHADFLEGIRSGSVSPRFRKDGAIGRWLWRAPDPAAQERPWR